MENTLSGKVIDKPKIRVIKKVIRKRPPTTPITDVEAAKLSEQLLNLNIDGNEATTTTTTTPSTTDTTKLQKKSDILKKTIKDKIHHDKLAYEAQMTLIEEDVTESQLKTHFYNLLQPEHYKDIITERSYAGKCGYPGCNKLLSSKKLNQKYLISIKDQKVYNVEELSMFCSADCLIKSKLYHSSLDATAVYLRGVESKKLSPTQDATDNDVEMTPTTTPTTPTTATAANISSSTTKPKPQPMEILNKFEKSLEITENENASLQPPNMEFGGTDHEKPIKKPTLKKQQQQQQNKKNNDNDEYLDDEIETETESSDNYDDDDDDQSINDIGEDYEGPMIPKEDDDEEEYDGQEIDKELDDKSDKSDDEFSLFRPVVVSNKKINELYKPSNYHLVYSALSQFTSKQTNQYLQGKELDQITPTTTTTTTNNITTKQNQQIKSSFLHSLSLVFPSISEELCFKNTTGKEIILLLVDTFKFDKPVPSLKRNHWKMLVLVFLKSLSMVHDVLSVEMNTHSSKFENLVSSCDFDMETLKVFQNLLTYGYD